MTTDVDYHAAVEYWSSQPSTVDGMLGGYGAPTSRVPRLDIAHSARFLKELDVPLGRALDCGAGIGRVTNDLLQYHATCVDLVEPCSTFTAQIERRNEKVGEVYLCGLQDFIFGQKYTIIWNQWCLGQLTDIDLVLYLQRCKKALPENGYIFVKENISSIENLFDDQDKSWTRTERSFQRIFKDAGLVIVKSSLQHGFPKELFKVKLWALK